MRKTFQERFRWYKYICKRYLLDIKENERNSKNDMERNYYAQRYAVQLKDFAEAAGWKPEWIDKFVQKKAL